MTTRDLVDAIVDGDSMAIQQTFERAMAERIAGRIDDMRQNVARGMFASEVAASDEAAD